MIERLDREESKARLRKLAWLLDNFDDQLPIINHNISSFNMNNWFRKNDPNAEILDKTDDYGDECGTTCCAVGAAMFHPWFQARGLGYVETLSGALPDTGEGEIGLFATVARWFGISTGEASYLFSPDAYTSVHSPDLVALRIYGFLRDRSNEDFYYSNECDLD